MTTETLPDSTRTPRPSMPAVRQATLFAACLVLLVPTGALAQSPAETDRDRCREQSRQLVDEGVLELDFEAFDQDMDGGWRLLMGQGCFVEAGELLDAWAEGHPGHDSAWLIHFHAGQAYAFGGESDTAIARFQMGHQPGGNRVWDLYVDANIAYLRDDRAELERLRAAMAEMGTPEQPAMNLDVVDRLLEHFGEPYAYAYSGGRMGG